MAKLFVLFLCSSQCEHTPVEKENERTAMNIFNNYTRYFNNKIIFYDIDLTYQ